MTLQRARERIAGLFGEECRDDGSGICAVHSEVLFDGRCEDYPTAYACVLAILDEELADDLGAAWAEAEAALPEGWGIHSLSVRPGLTPPERWECSAWGKAREDRVYVYGPTPAAALLALTAVLRARP